MSTMSSTTSEHTDSLPQATYGRNRQSIADIEQQLYQIFNDHPDAHNGVELLDDSEMEGLKQLLAASPTIQVTPHMLLQFVAARTGHSPDKSPRDEPLPDEDLTLLPERGRDPHWTHHPNLSRNSSRDSAGTMQQRYRTKLCRRWARG